MKPDLLKAFTKSEILQEVGKGVKLMSLAFQTNKRTGTKLVRAVLDNGVTLIKEVTESGVILETITKIPEITSISQRNAIIKELYQNKNTQSAIAAMLNISQSTVSAVLRKK
ncbi:MAG: helix-turn-helix domain containing protein [Oscillospiraceae bacterium]|nr:helix-turn-helix domain containing protein [Oscillospiraceae bacterium]